MNSSSLYPCSDLQGIALEIVELLKPYCERIEIAGSIRREKPMVKDGTIVCIRRRRGEGAVHSFVVMHKDDKEAGA